MDNKVSQIVLDKITKEMEVGTIPWHMPWIAIPKQNLTSKKAYSGINRLLLSGDIEDYYISFNQAKTLNGHIKAGSKARLVIFYKPLILKKKNNKGEDVEEMIPILRYYNVFRLADVDNISRPVVENSKDNKKLDTIENFIKKVNPLINYYGSQACYSPKEDTIYIPELNRFESQNHYYCTLLHELIHWTGSKDRLNRFNDDKQANYAENYGKEELTAEIGSAILAYTYGIDIPKASASYLQSWLKQIKQDSRLLFSACSKAEKAIEYINNLIGGVKC